MFINLLVRKNKVAIKIGQKRELEECKILHKLPDDMIKSTFKGDVKTEFELWGDWPSINMDIWVQNPLCGVDF